MSKNLTIDESNESNNGKYNIGFGESLREIPRLEKNGYKVEIIYIDELTKKDLPNIYRKIVEFSKRHGLGIKEPYGKKGWRFGKEVPAVVEYVGDSINKIYPHLDYTDIKTIKDYFESLLKNKVSAV